MSEVHITNIKSLRAGIKTPPQNCYFCNHKTVFLSWVGWNCDTCGFDSECYLPDNIRRIREKTGLSRKDAAKIFGLKNSTLKNYEWTNPSKVFLTKFLIFIKEFYK